MKGGNLFYQDNHQNFNSPIDLQMRAGCHPFLGSVQGIEDECMCRWWGLHHMHRLVLKGWFF